MSFHIIGKKKYDTKNQCTTLFSDQCTVSDEAFGRFTIERCWDIWLRKCKVELNKNNDKKKGKIKHQYAIKKQTRDLVAGQEMA